MVTATAIENGEFCVAVAAATRTAGDGDVTSSKFTDQMSGKEMKLQGSYCLLRVTQAVFFVPLNVMLASREISPFDFYFQQS